jgi:hypothetical protein
MANWKESNPTIDRNNVLMVYTGKSGCMCGCGGKYRYPKANVDLALTSRGYALEPEEINEGTVTRVLNQLAKLTDVEVGEIYGRNGDSLFYCWNNNETGHRLAVYTKPGAPYVRPEVVTHG